MAVKNYKCPGCGASMVYDEGTHSMVCPYCNTKVPVTGSDAGDPKVPKMHAKAEEQKGAEAEDASGTGQKVYHCSNCGAELIAGENTAATFCSFCGSPTLIENRLTGSWKPDYVIPFQLKKEQAQDIFRKWTKKGVLTPGQFSSQTTLDSITGMYVPYWLFDFGVNVDMEAEASRTHTERHGNVEHIITDHYLLERNTHSEFEKIPADASEKMPDDTMERLEPFEYQQLEKFQMEYLSGFLAEKYDYDSEKMAERGKERAAQYAEDETRKTMNGYDSVTVTRRDISIAQKQADYAMLPIWVLNYRYRGKNWMLYLNGQTGRKVGKLPVSVGRAAAVFGASSAVIFGIAMLIGGLL